MLVKVNFIVQYMCNIVGSNRRMMTKYNRQMNIEMKEEKRMKKKSFKLSLIKAKRNESANKMERYILGKKVIFQVFSPLPAPKTAFFVYL